MGTYLSQIAKFMGQHGAHLGPVGPRWAPCWPYEPCYQGCHGWSNCDSGHKGTECLLIIRTGCSVQVLFLVWSCIAHSICEWLQYSIHWRLGSWVRILAMTGFLRCLGSNPGHEWVPEMPGFESWPWMGSWDAWVRILAMNGFLRCLGSNPGHEWVPEMPGFESWPWMGSWDAWVRILANDMPEGDYFSPFDLKSLPVLLQNLNSTIDMQFHQ